jgi:hypothetical protein
MLVKCFVKRFHMDSSQQPPGFNTVLWLAALINTLERVSCFQVHASFHVPKHTRSSYFGIRSLEKILYIQASDWVLEVIYVGRN